MSDRVTARISDELSDKLNHWSKKLGLTKSQLAGMAITAGFDAILRAVSPVDALTAEQWAKITLEMAKQDGAPIVLPDGRVIGGDEKKEKQEEV